VRRRVVAGAMVFRSVLTGSACKYASHTMEVP
jgi:hypothetical protein